MGIPVYFAVYFLGVEVSVFLWKELGTTFRLLAVMLILTLCAEFTALCIRNVYGNNMWVYHIYSVLLIPLFYFIFRRFLKPFRYERLLSFLYGSLFVYGISSSRFDQPLHEFPSHIISLLGLCVVFSSLLVFKTMLDEPSRTRLVRQGKFWFVTAAFLYWACMLFRWSTYNLVTQVDALMIIHYFSITMLCLYYPALTCSLWINSEERKVHAGQS